MCVFVSPLPLTKSLAALFIILAYCIGVFWKDSINLPSGDACCCEIISGLADCCETSVDSWKSKNACFSASTFVIPSFIKALTLFL